MADEHEAASVAGAAAPPHLAAIVAIYAEVLDTAVGRDSDFFELGGSSLAAAVIAEEIRDALSLEVRARDLFEHPTPLLLSAHVTADGFGARSDA